MTLVPTQHIVLDIETLGTEITSVILSAGLCRVMYNTHTGRYEVASEQDCLYTVFRTVEQLIAGRTVDLATQQWWSDKSPEAQAVIQQSMLATRPDSVSLSQVANFITMVTDQKTPAYVEVSIRQLESDTVIWGRGPRFDNNLLGHFFVQMFGHEPWKFRNDRCLRTIDDMMISHCTHKNECWHHALHDAIHEAHSLVQVANQMLDAGIDFLKFAHSWVKNNG